MVNKKSLPREDRKHLREFLSFNPFFKEMETHLHKMAYGKNGYSDEHLCLEQMWLLAIDFLHKSNLVYNDTGVLADPDLHDGEDFLLPGSGDWHLMYVHLIREMYFKRNVHFVFL